MDDATNAVDELREEARERGVNSEARQDRIISELRMIKLALWVLVGAGIALMLK